MAEYSYASLLVPVWADTRPLEKEVRSTATRVGTQAGQQIAANAGKEVSKRGGGLGRAFGSLGQLTRLATPALAAVFGGGVLLSGVKYVANLEQATTGFKTMLGSGRAATSMVKDLQAFAAKTPFNFPDLVTSSQRLIAFGFNAKQVIPTLTAVGDAAAGLGLGSEGVDRITTAIGQMQAKTRVQSDELLQLTEAGVPALRILANQYHVSTAEMQKMVTAGAVSSSKAIPLLLSGLEKGTKGAAGMTTAFGGLMKAQSTSLTGLWSNFVDTANQKLGQLLTPAMPAIKSTLGVLTDLISGKGPLAQGFQGLMRVVGPVLGGLMRNVGTFSKQMAAGLADLLPVLLPVAEVIGGVLLIGLKELGWVLANVVGPAFKAIAGFIRQNETLFLSLGTAIGIVTVALNLWRVGLMVVAIQMKVMAVLTRGWAIAQGILNAVMAANPIMLVVVALVALGAALYVAWTRSATFRQIVETAFNAVKSVAMAVVNWFAGPFLRFFTVTIPGIFNAVLRWVKTNWPLIVGFLTGPIGLAVVLIIRYWTQIRNFITNTVGAIWRIVTSVFTNIRNFIGGIAGSVQRTVASWWSNVVSTVTGALSRAWANLSGWFARLPGQIAAWGAAAVRGWARLGSDMIGGLLGGISGAMRNIASWVNRVVVQPIVGAVKRFFGIHSPSTVMEGIGGNLTAGLFKGLAADAGGIVKMVFGGWPAALGGLVAKGFAALTALPGKALSALGSVAGKVGGWFKGLFGGGSGAGVAQWRGLMLSVLQMFGIPQLLGTFMTQMNTESGGNPKAINLTDSNARAGIPSKGLMQVIDPTFNAYAGPFRGRGIWDPLANIYAAVAYAVARYGANIVNVLGHGHGYAQGGTITEPVLGFGARSRMPYLFGEAGDERVSPLRGGFTAVERALLASRSGSTIINVYPREGQSETAIAASVNAHLHWAAAGGQA